MKGKGEGGVSNAVWKEGEEGGRHLAVVSRAILMMKVGCSMVTLTPHNTNPPTTHTEDTPGRSLADAFLPPPPWLPAFLPPASRLNHPTLPHPPTTQPPSAQWRSTPRPPSQSRPPPPSPSPCPPGPTVVSQINSARRCVNWGLSIAPTARHALRMAAQVFWLPSTALVPRASPGRNASKEQRSR